MNTDFCKLGDMVYKRNSNKFNLHLNFDVNVKHIKFIFILLDNNLIPFEVVSINEEKKNIEMSINDIDTIDNLMSRKLKVFLENEKFNSILKNDEDVNIINFTVLNEVSDKLGYVSEIFNYPMNRCVEITFNSKKYLVPFNKKFVKKINRIEKTVVIFDETILT